MSYRPKDLYASPNALAPHYSRFKVDQRVLLTGHSHQAWPDCGFEGQKAAWLDAAEAVDAKWDRAQQMADRVRQGYRQLLDDPSGLYSLAGSTHDLLVRLLSALPWSQRPKLVATDREFYSLDRQLRRLDEEGLEIIRVPAHPAESVGERLAAATCDRTAAVFCSTVFFSSAHIAGDLTPAAKACRRHGAALVLDLYHQLNVVPFSLRQKGLEDAYAVSAGYKYCQLGEGNAILRFPPDCKLRPIATGWFAEFGELAVERSGSEKVTYKEDGDRFAGATYDPTSHYRAAAVFDFFEQSGLSVELLREVNQHQIRLLQERFDELDLPAGLVDRDRSVSPDQLGGFLCLESPLAGEIHTELGRRGIMTDSRGRVLRLGPAPYLSDAQLEQAIGTLADVVRSLALSKQPDS